MMFIAITLAKVFRFGLTKSESLEPGGSVRVMEHQGKSAIVLAVNLELLAAEAEKSTA